ncbi:acyl-CoA dehydrogenase family protein [Mycobacterium yunnanensis]|uniref:Acyl-CoA dehydrogenase family protein n=1 Tax=Mycobacterium yunnanensis TaxID=368477 RepID=A0A9X2Z489_9MYCO|nr:acyl-CoA dehydrogenase [Mycobacterium yunnanensis]MCV7423108.1 acyl-CoA dehydrogenase family protein [Mycobacterium yunnanensis]
MDRYELRRLDYSLTEDHVDLQVAYRGFFESHCPIEVVRAAEAGGFDPALWDRLCAMGATTMALSGAHGGDAATLVDLTLVAEEIGRAIAPVPWVGHVVTSRLLAALGAFDGDGVLAEALLSGRSIAGLDLDTTGAGGRRLVASGAVADHVVVVDGNDVVRLTFDTHRPVVDNIARLPMAWIDPAEAASRTVVATGPAALEKYERAVDEWRLLVAASLVGLVEKTLDGAVEFAKNRRTHGVTISTLQAISHPLADIAIVVQSGRNLARRAAWFLDHEPEERSELAASAFVFMTDEAAKAATTAVHVQGGLGVSVESSASAYLVRARGWPLAAGDVAVAAARIAKVVVERERRSDAAV